MDLIAIQSDIEAVVLQAGEFIARHVHNVTANDIIEKELNSLVSYVDREAEQLLVNGLRQLITDAGFVTEEDTPNQTGKPYTWIIDPLDGTTNFLHKVPHFSVSVALADVSGHPISGVVLEVNSGELWSAVKGQGAHLGGKSISVTEKDFDQVLIATGFPYRNDIDYDLQFDVIKYWLQHNRGIRRMGSAALDLCYVACGRFGAYYEGYLNPWDVAAGALIVQEAGGMITDYQGGSSWIDGSSIIAAAPPIYTTVQPIISKLSIA